jgi:hypothetical protein
MSAIGYRWIPAATLRRSYLALVVPGAPPGAAHLVEHLYYRQSDRHASLLDDSGGWIGMLTRAETMSAVAIVPHERAGEIAASLLAWWATFDVTPELLEEERRSVIDEVRVARGDGARRAYSLAMRALCGAEHHLASDLAGDEGMLSALGADAVVGYQHEAASGGGMLVSIGPAPLRDERACAVWRVPPRPLPPPAPDPRLHTKTSGASAVPTALILGARLFDGLRGESSAGIEIAHGALALGHVHPAQRAFYRGLGLRFLAPEIHRYADCSVLTVRARSPIERADEVRALVTHMLEDPLAGSSPSRAARCAAHELGRAIDDPRARVEDSARRAVVGARSLEEELARIEALGAEGAVAAVAASFRSGTCTSTISSS